MRNMLKTAVASVVALSATDVVAFSWPPRIVYFDSGSAILKRDQLQTVLQAMQEAPTLLSVPLYFQVRAYTDSVGSEEDNRRLSCARAQSVRNALISRGVPPNRFLIQAFGETRHAVDTPDEVEERRNRRVEIDYRPLGPSGEVPRSSC